MWVRRAVLGLIALLFHGALAGLVNISIDDTYGDLTNGQKPIYQPSGPWFGPRCGESCILGPQPSASSAFDGTWTAATYDPSNSSYSNTGINITFSFTGQKISLNAYRLPVQLLTNAALVTGVSVWVFFIIVNEAQLLGGITLHPNTQCNFTLDGNYAGAFSHQPDASADATQYNVTAFSASGLNNSRHELVISTNVLPAPTYVNFDYAIYAYVYPVIISACDSDVILGLMFPTTLPRRRQLQDLHPLVESAPQDLQ